MNMFINHNVFSKEKVKLTANEVNYSENKKVINAKGNVNLRYKNTELIGNKVKLDTEKKHAFASGNIKVKNATNEFYSKSVFFDLENNIFTANDIKFHIKPEDSKTNLLIKSKFISKQHTHELGEEGVITSCLLPNPHYYIYAQRFKHKKDKYIEGTNVYFHNPIFGIPLPIFSPYYKYDIGKRKLIWNFPTIGKKETPGWGWFVQNTIDYDYLNNKESSILLDWYENQGVGYGIVHQYDLFNIHQGEVYYYQLSQQNGKLNQKMRLIDNIKFDSHHINLDYQNSNATRITHNSEQNEIHKKLNYTYNDIGDIYNSSFQESQYIIQKYNNNNFSINHSFNSEEKFSLNHNETKSFASNQKNSNTTFIHKIKLSDTQQLNSNFKFNKNGNFVTDPHFDERLNTQLILTDKLSDHVSIQLNIDTMIDLDEDRVTRDSQSYSNNYFYKLPELTLQLNNLDFFGFKVNNSSTIANYQETNYNQLLKRQETLYLGNLYPNTLIFKNSLTRSFINSATNSNLYVKLGYDQYLFKNPNIGFFEGDAIYRYTIHTTYSQTVANSINLSTTYSRSFVHDNSNSPFYYFSNIIQNQSNRISQSINLFYKNINQYNWSHTTSYDWHFEKWSPYTTSLLIHPNESLRLFILTGINDISKSFKQSAKSTEKVIYQPLQWSIFSKINQSNNINFYLAQDLNLGQINSSYASLSFLSEPKNNYEWEVSLQFNYNLTGQRRSIALNRYELNQFNIIKHDHCRSFTFSYNKSIDEFKFKVTILAFPEDSFGFKRTKELWKVEGILDDTTSERF